MIRINYEKGTYEMSSITFSEVLLALLGISVEQASEFLLRKGIFEFSFSQEEFNQEMLFLWLFREKKVFNYNCDLTIKTFDEIDVCCTLNFKILNNS